MANKTTETDSVKQRLKRIGAELSRIERTGLWPVYKVCEREGDHYFSIGIVSPFPPEDDSE